MTRSGTIHNGIGLILRVTKAVSQRMKPYEEAMFKKINAGKGRCKCMVGRKGRKRKRGWWGVGKGEGR
jgi:hypothetical protein